MLQAAKRAPGLVLDNEDINGMGQAKLETDHMRKLWKVFLPSPWLVLMSACTSQMLPSPAMLKTSPPDIPDKAPPNVVIGIQGGELGFSQAFARTLGEELSRAGVNLASAMPSGPSAIIRVGAKQTTYTYYFSRSSSSSLFVPNANRFMADVTFMNGSEGSKPYLSIGFSINGGVHGISMGESGLRYEEVESRNELKAKAARLITALYLNALSGHPEPIEGEWMDVGGSGATVVFHKGREANHYSTDETFATIYGSSDITPVMQQAEIGKLPAYDPYPKMPSVDNIRSFKGKYRIISADHFRIYGCLMIVQGEPGRVFLVKKNLQRCHY